MLFRHFAAGLATLVGLSSVTLAHPVAAAPAASSPVRYSSFKDQSVQVHLVEVDLKRPQVKLGVALAKGYKSNTGERVTKMAMRENAVAAINGSFFHGTKIPSVVGLLMRDDQIIADSGHRRTSLGLTRDNDVIIGVPKIQTGLYQPKKDQFKGISGVNQLRRQGQTIVYTPHFGKYTQTNKWGREVVVENNRISRYVYNNSQIPRNGFVISAQGKGAKEIQEMYPLGSKIFLRAKREGPWTDVHTILTGAPHLVRKGKIYNTFYQENMHSSIKRPAARTAVGITHNRKLLMVNVVPRKGSGITLTRLAQIMKRLGATEAMGMDGGGSTSLYVSQQGIKNASRPVSNALIVTLEK